jgi:hypothetical protein
VSCARSQGRTRRPALRRSAQRGKTAKRRISFAGGDEEEEEDEEQIEEEEEEEEEEAPRATRGAVRGLASRRAEARSVEDAIEEVCERVPKCVHCVGCSKTGTGGLSGWPGAQSSGPGRCHWARFPARAGLQARALCQRGGVRLWHGALQGDESADHPGGHGVDADSEGMDVDGEARGEGSQLEPDEEHDAEQQAVLPTEEQLPFRKPKPRQRSKCVPASFAIRSNDCCRIF